MSAARRLSEAMMSRLPMSGGSSEMSSSRTWRAMALRERRVTNVQMIIATISTTNTIANSFRIPSTRFLTLP